MLEKSWPCLQLLDLRVDCADRAVLLDYLESAIQHRQSVHVVTLNPEIAYQAATEEIPELKPIIQQAEIVTPDGIGIVWALRKQGFRVARFPGIELVQMLLQAATEKGYRVFILGSRPDTLTALTKRFQTDYPKLTIVGMQDGFFVEEEIPTILETIKQARPDILFVALGVPKQEKWIARYRQAIDVPVKIGVGGSLDVLSGQLKRAPTWMQKVHLEWFYRLLKQPTRWRRMLVLPRFVLKVLKQ